MSSLSKTVLDIIEHNETGERIAEALTHLLEYGELEAERRGYSTGYHAGYNTGYNSGYYNGARDARLELENER